MEGADSCHPKRTSRFAFVYWWIFTAQNIETSFKFSAEKELGFGVVLPNFRLAVTGLGMGPSMFQISALLGKEEVLGKNSSGITKN